MFCDIIRRREEQGESSSSSEDEESGSDLEGASDPDAMAASEGEIMSSILNLLSRDCLALSVWSVVDHLVVLGTWFPTIYSHLGFRVLGFIYFYVCQLQKVKRMMKMIEVKRMLKPWNLRR